ASVRAGLHAMVSRPGIEVIGEIAGSEGLSEAIESDRPDILLLDHTPLDGTRVISVAVEAGIPIVALGEEREGYRELSRSSPGGWGYLLKDSEGEEIAGALLAASAGVAAIDRSLFPDITPALTAAIGEESAVLTKREMEVLQLMAQGLPNKAIAARLGITAHTVKYHVAAILSKL